MKADQEDQSMAMQEAVARLMPVKEDLHPDLVPCVDRSGPPYLWCIRHPLLHTSLLPNAVLNHYYLHAKGQLAEAVEKGDLLAWIFMHEQPYRVGALHGLAGRLDHGTYWEVLGEIYTQVENR